MVHVDKLCTLVNCCKHCESFKSNRGVVFYNQNADLYISIIINLTISNTCSSFAFYTHFIPLLVGLVTFNIFAISFSHGVLEICELSSIAVNL